MCHTVSSFIWIIYSRSLTHYWVVYTDISLYIQKQIVYISYNTTSGPSKCVHIVFNPVQFDDKDKAIAMGYPTLDYLAFPT